jgi:hypothetical protein
MLSNVPTDIKKDKNINIGEQVFQACKQRNISGYALQIFGLLGLNLDSMNNAFSIIFCYFAGWK